MRASATKSVQPPIPHKISVFVFLQGEVSFLREENNKIETAIKEKYKKIKVRFPDAQTVGDKPMTTRLAKPKRIRKQEKIARSLF